MTGLTEYLARPFEMLDEHTTDEADQHGVYAETRTEGGLYSITSTQSGRSTYAAYESEQDEPMPGTVQPREPGTFDCADPRTCPDCRPLRSE